MNKKTKEKKETIQSKTSILIFSLIIFLIIFIIIGNLSNSDSDNLSDDIDDSTSNVESITLSIPKSPKEYDIYTDIPVKISVIPENADTSSFEYITSDESIYFSDTGIITGSKEGRYSVFVKSGDVLSNSISFSVVNSSEQQSDEEYNEEWTRRTIKASENDTKIRSEQITYVLNTDTFKIHYPSCNDVNKIDSENYSTSSLSIEELESQGYTVCEHCFDD